MGWLKPAESLLEPKGIWETHRDPPPDGPVPEPAEGIVAKGQTVKGVRIGSAGAVRINEIDLERRKSMDCAEREMVVDDSFDFVPGALLLGVPLMFKRIIDPDCIASVVNVSFAVAGKDVTNFDEDGFRAALASHFAADDVALSCEGGRAITANVQLIFQTKAAAQAALGELEKSGPEAINEWTEITAMANRPQVLASKPPTLEAEEIRYETKMYAYKVTLAPPHAGPSLSNDASLSSETHVTTTTQHSAHPSSSTIPSLSARHPRAQLMTTPGLGLPLTWNQNGIGTKLPPILVRLS